MKRVVFSVLLLLFPVLLFPAFTGLAQSTTAFNSQDATSTVGYLQEAEKELQKTDLESTLVPELRPDLPKLDTSKPQAPAAPNKRSPLKGSVQHQELFKGKANGGLEGSGSGQFDGTARQGQVEGRAHKGGFRGRLGHNDGPDEMGLGIIGVKFVMAFGRTPIIYQVFPGTPAYEVGMRPRDIILAVDGIPTAGLNKDEVYNMIVGQPNTMVTISFKRKHDFQIRQIMRMDLNKIGDPTLRRDYLRM